jgi:membrane protein
MNTKGMGRVLKGTGSEFVSDDCMASGAAIAYYTIFSLPSLLAIVFAIALQFWSEDTVNQVIQSQLGLPLAEGENSAESPGEGGSLATIAQRAQSDQEEKKAWWAQIIGIAILLISASGVLAQLQASLNRAWNVEPDPNAGGFKNFILKRALSFGMLVVIGLLLLVSLVLTTLLDEFTRWLEGGVLEGATFILLGLVNYLLAWGLATLLFAAAFKILPDARIQWRDVWVGALATGLLFVIGKSLIAWYLNYSHAGSSWGTAAASLVGILIWVYYSSLIILLGAEFTQQWALAYGSGLKAAPGARLVTQEKNVNLSEEDVRKTQQLRQKPQAT